MIRDLVLWLRLVFAPSEADLAERFVRLFARDGVEARYDPAKHEVSAGSQVVYLLNLLADLRAASLRGRVRILSFQKLLSASPSAGRPETLEDALPLLLPRVTDRAFFQPWGGLPTPLPHEPLGDDLGVCLVLDGEGSVSFVSHDDLARWGRSLADLLPIAKRNLGAVTDASGFVEVAPGVFRSAYRDTYDNARLLFLPELEKLSLPGDLVLSVTSRDGLFVTGTKVPGGVDRLLELTEVALAEEPRAFHGVLLRARGRTLERFDDPRPAVVHRHVVARARDHEEQRRWLEETAEGDDPPFPASFKVYEGPGGEVFTTAVWPDCATLLPEVDRVFFVVAPETEHERMFVVAWADVVELARSSLVETDHFPRRHLVTGLPPDEVLRALEARAME